MAFSSHQVVSLRPLLTDRKIIQYWQYPLLQIQPWEKILHPRISQHSKNNYGSNSNFFAFWSKTSTSISYKSMQIKAMVAIRIMDLLAHKPLSMALSSLKKKCTLAYSFQRTRKEIRSQLHSKIRKMKISLTPALTALNAYRWLAYCSKKNWGTICNAEMVKRVGERAEKPFFAKILQLVPLIRTMVSSTKGSQDWLPKVFHWKISASLRKRMK